MRPGFICGTNMPNCRYGKAHWSHLLHVRSIYPIASHHVENCADCIVAAAERPTAIGETFNVIDDDDIRVWRYVREFVRHTGARGILLPVPYSFGLGSGKDRGTREPINVWQKRQIAVFANAAPFRSSV